MLTVVNRQLTVNQAEGTLSGLPALLQLIIISRARAASPSHLFALLMKCCRRPSTLPPGHCQAQACGPAGGRQRPDAHAAGGGGGAATEAARQGGGRRGGAVWWQVSKQEGQSEAQR